ncbi:MAG: DNA-binding protein [Gallionella sp.]|nr:DNA-binding protein [Gallionella sp.]
MPRESTITYNMVAAIADSLFKQGKKPTARAVREALGVGSMAMILKHLRQWHDSREHQRPIVDAGMSITPASRQKRTEKAAIYQVDGVSVDVTDLLNIDFEILDLASDAMTHVSTTMARASGEDRAKYLSEVLTNILDRQSDRVLELSARLGEVDAPPPRQSVHPENVRPSIVAQCARLNRLGGRAGKNDYITLYTGGQDDFSAMSIGELQEIIHSDKWLEMQIRLRASGMLISTNVVKVARWVARGLDVRHAINKILVDNEVYTTESRPASAFQRKA